MTCPGAATQLLKSLKCHIIPYTRKFWRPLNLAKWHEMARYKIWRSRRKSMTSLCAPRAQHDRLHDRHTKRRAVSWPSCFQQHLEANNQRTAIREVSNAHDVYTLAVMHGPGQVLAEDGTQSAMTACSAVCSLSMLLIQCTLCEGVGASPQTSLSVSSSSILRTGEMFFRHDICTALLTQEFEGESGSGTSETWYHWKAHEME